MELDLESIVSTKQQAVKPYQLLVALDGEGAAKSVVCIDNGISVDSVAADKFTKGGFEAQLAGWRQHAQVLVKAMLKRVAAVSKNIFEPPVSDFSVESEHASSMLRQFPAFL